MASPPNSKDSGLFYSDVQVLEAISLTHLYLGLGYLVRLHNFGETPPPPPHCLAVTWG